MPVEVLVPEYARGGCRTADSSGKSPGLPLFRTLHENRLWSVSALQSLATQPTSRRRLVRRWVR